MTNEYIFFKQKTAYEISTRDWSSDVCSSDLFPSGRGQDVTGRKCVIFRTKTRAAPSELRFHRWAGPWNSAFDRGAGNSRDRHRHKHRQENVHPFFAVPPPGDS